MKSLTRLWITAFLLALLAFAAGCDVLSPDSNQTLQASGLIEADEISVSPELSGVVLSVSVAEGDTVRAGDELFSLDDSLLQAERLVADAALSSAEASVQTAQAALDSARLQYDLTLSEIQAAEQATRLATWDQTKPGEFDQPTWYFLDEERYTATQVEVENALADLEAAEERLASVENQVGSAAFLAAEERLAQARIAFTIADQVLDSTSGASDSQTLRDVAQDIYDDAETELEDAQKAYDDELSADAAADLLNARAEVAVARERYDAAVDALRALQTGERSPAARMAAQAVTEAEALLAQAQTAVDQAQAQIALIDTQAAKLTITAPRDGMILTRSIQPGEAVQAGMSVMVIGKLDRLTVTVYIPENRYGEINIGDVASLSVDSFPAETFSASVTRISDQAEYTPRNVQTREERQTTVYAVELSVNNPDGKLKPGMAVDVDFGK